MKESTPIIRLKKFVRWAKDNGLCKTNNEFEEKCGLSNCYLNKSVFNKNGEITTSVLAKIIKQFPMLNLVWICTGEGEMILGEPDVNIDYKQAYEGAMMQIEALNRIISKK